MDKNVAADVEIKRPVALSLFVLVEMASLERFGWRICRGENVSISIKGNRRFSIKIWLN